MGSACTMIMRTTLFILVPGIASSIAPIEAARVRERTDVIRVVEPQDEDDFDEEDWETFEDCNEDKRLTDKREMCDTSGDFNVCVDLVCNGIDGDYKKVFRECCSESHPCDIDQGDCDNDSECSGDLVCGQNNCPSPFPSRADCCEQPS